MADKDFKIQASIEVNDKQIETEFTKAWEEAWKSVKQWLEKQQWNIVETINSIADEIKTKMEALQDIDFSLIDPDRVEEDMQFLQGEITSLDNKIQNIQRWSGWQEFWDEWQQAFENVMSIADEYKDALYNSMDAVQTLWIKGGEAMDELEEQTREAKEETQRLNDTANQWISENGWLWKMLKFLSSKEIFNFFYRNLKKIWEKLIELSWDSEMLASKRQPIQDKLETVWWYIWTGLVPAVESAIDEIGSMADELTKTWEDWSSSMDMLQKGIYWIWQAFLAVIKVIKQFWAYLGIQVSNWAILFQALWGDFLDTAQSAIEWIWNVENWEALWNNIKYWVVKWVNGAIESLNGMLGWIKKNLWIDLWEIDTFDTWKKQDFNFITISSTRTQEALKDIARTNVDFV